VPAVPPCIVETIWKHFRASATKRSRTHPLYTAIGPADPIGCSSRSWSRFRCSVAPTGVSPTRSAGPPRCAVDATSGRSRSLVAALEDMSLDAYHDRVVVRELSEMAFDCRITKAPSGGEKTDKSPVDRGKRGTTHSMIVDD
jgi:hypothetical protein